MLLTRSLAYDWQLWLLIGTHSSPMISLFGAIYTASCRMAMTTTLKINRTPQRPPHRALWEHVLARIMKRQKKDEKSVSLPPAERWIVAAILKTFFMIVFKFKIPWQKEFFLGSKMSIRGLVGLNWGRLIRLSFQASWRNNPPNGRLWQKATSVISYPWFTFLQARRWTYPAEIRD